MNDVAESIATVIPAHQAARFVADAIDSVLAQDHPIAEIVVVDDGSTDGTSDVVRRYEPHVQLIVQAQRGAGAARARGLAATTAPLLAFLDADDVWLPHAVSVLAAALEAHPAALLAYGELDVFADRIELDGSSEATRLAVVGKGPSLIASASLIRRSAFDVVGPFASDNASMVDWFARAIESGGQLLAVPTVVTRRRVHDQNTSAWDPTVRASFAKIIKASLDRRRNTIGPG